MWRRRLAAGVASAATALVVLALAFALEIAILDRAFGPRAGWDPVSIWRQGVIGKMFVVLALGLPILIPLSLSAVAGTYIYRRIVGRVT